jgi:WS/DGAT/MGAT family acyltransferase
MAPREASARIDAMPSLSAIDRAFFMLETEQRPMNVGLLVVAEPGHPPRGQRPSDRLVERMLRVPVGPPFYYRLTEGLLPTLVVDDHVDAEQHLYRHQLPRGSDLQALFARLCTLHVQRLDRTRPLWEMHVFDGLPGDRVALYFKTHHGLLDGVGFIKAINGSVSLRPGGRTNQAIWRGLPELARSSSGHRKARPGLLATGVGLVRSGVEAAGIARDMARLALHVGRREMGLGRGMALPFLETPNLLKAEPSPNRVLGHCSISLERVRQLARANETKINDLMLACLDTALSEYLAERGETPSRPLIADMPVALPDDSSTGNRITILQVPLGRPGGTPAQRLEDIVRETRIVKDEVRMVGPDALFYYSIIEHSVASAIETLNLSALPMLANCVISNPAGIDGPVWLNGARVELALPVSVVAHHQVVNITISNYAGNLHVTFISLREAIPDAQHLADLTQTAFGKLERSLRATRRDTKGTTGRSRKRAARQPRRRMGT